MLVCWQAINQLCMHYLTSYRSSKTAGTLSSDQVIVPHYAGSKVTVSIFSPSGVDKKLPLTYHLEIRIGSAHQSRTYKVGCKQFHMWAEWTISSFCVSLYHLRVDRQRWCFPKWGCHFRGSCTLRLLQLGPVKTRIRSVTTMCCSKLDYKATQLTKPQLTFSKHWGLISNTLMLMGNVLKEGLANRSQFVMMMLSIHWQRCHLKSAMTLCSELKDSKRMNVEPLTHSRSSESEVS